MITSLPPETRVAQLLRTNKDLAGIVSLEPALQTLLVLAASQQECWNRWHAYEILKRACGQFVGWSASQLALRNTNMYNHVLEAVDALLPSDDEEDERERQHDFRGLRDSVLQLCPEVKLPGWCAEELAG